MDGTKIYAPELCAATSSDIGGIKTDGEFEDGKKAVKLDSNNFAYVEVPTIKDKFLLSAEYDHDTHKIYLSVGTTDDTPTVLSIDVGDLVDTYTADEKTLALSGKTFSVKDNVFADSIKNGEFTLSGMTLGEYLSALTVGLGGSVN